MGCSPNPALDAWHALACLSHGFAHFLCPQVQHAADAGAVAAIVYDDVYESLIIMSKPKGHPEPTIPSVFITQRGGIIIRSLMDLREEVHVHITPVRGQGCITEPDHGVQRSQTMLWMPPHAWLRW